MKENIGPVALGTQHTMHMPYIFINGLPYFSTLSHKLHDFRNKQKKGYWTWNVFRFSSKIIPETFIILSRTDQDMIKIT